MYVYIYIYIYIYMFIFIYIYIYIYICTHMYALRSDASTKGSPPVFNSVGIQVDVSKRGRSLT